MQSGMKSQQPPRRQRAYISIVGTTQLHLRSPFIIAAWSVMFPGLGHLLLSKYIRGFVLFGWEIFVNIKSHINLGILYTFTGRFEMAQNILDTKWMLLYIPTYLFTIWDSYRTTVDLNNDFLLSAREDAIIQPYVIKSLEINSIDKRSPLVSAIWSMMMPGTGELYNHQIISAFFTLTWWIVVVQNSNALQAFHHTMLGDFDTARAMLNPQWVLNIPSIYFFAVYDSYTNTVENNKLFDWEQSRFLSENYQNKNFRLPSKIKVGQGDAMYVVSTFEQSKNLELAITALQEKGIKMESIFAIPLDKRNEKRKLFDSLHTSDGLSLLDLPFVLGAVCTLFGAIYGFILPLGPMPCGLIGLCLGIAVGLVIRVVTTKKNKIRSNNDKQTEVILIIECSEDQLNMIHDTLWNHHALGMRRLDHQSQVI